MINKKGWIALFLALTLLALSGCGDGKKREEAAAMLEEGKFAEAYMAYSGLQDREMKEDTKNKAFAAAQEAYDKGDFDRAAEILESFTQFREFKSLLEDVKAAQSGTYVTDVKLEGSNLSFTLNRAEQDMESSRVRIRLEAKNEQVSGWIYGMIEPADLPEGSPCTVTVDLNETKWSASMGKFSFFDNAIFDIGTAAIFNSGTMAQFTKCIRTDGTEGLTMGLVLVKFGFGNTLKTFAGGKVFVTAISDGTAKPTDTILRGERSADIPAEEKQQ